MAQPASLLERARNVVLKATGIDQSKDVFPSLGLPKSVVNHLTSTFKTSDFFINKDDVTPEDVHIGLYKAVCKIDGSAVLLKIVDVASASQDELSDLCRWEHIQHDGIQKCCVSFNEEGKHVFVLEYMRRADEIVRHCRTSSISLTENFLWSVLSGLSDKFLFCRDNDLSYPNLQTHKVGVLKNGCVAIQNGILSHDEQLQSAQESFIMADDMDSVGVYTPPEIIDGEEPTHKTLVWQIGAVVYELATQRPAYQVTDANDVFSPLGEIMEGTMPPPLSGNYSNELNQVLQKCLSYLADSRPTLSELSGLSESRLGDDACVTEVLRMFDE